MKLCLFTLITFFGCFAPTVVDGETRLISKSGGLRGGSRRLQQLRSLEISVFLDRYGQFEQGELERLDDLTTMADLPTWTVSLDGADLGQTNSNGIFKTQENPENDFLLKAGMEVCVRIEPELQSNADDARLSATSDSGDIQSTIFGNGAPSG
jgi:hypothetical protein